MCKKELSMSTAPTVGEFLERFKDEKKNMEFLLKYIFPEGKLVCVNCGCTDFLYHDKRYYRTLVCRHCGNHSSIFNGTIFENTHFSFKGWLHIMYSMLVARRGVSGCRLVSETGVSEISVYQIRRRIQLAMMNYDLQPFTGDISMDEVYLGGSNHGRYARDKEKTEKIKYPVFGLCEASTGRVYSRTAIPNNKGQYLTSKQIENFVESTCKPGSTIISDEWKSYRTFDKADSKYHHEAVNHKEYKYANENGYSSSNLEGYWSEVKKLYYSTHSYLNRNYINFYLAEADFRHNHQEWESGFEDLLKQVTITPRVIDIRKMGKFGNRTYDLKDYRMILPASFDEVPLEQITVKDILECDEVVIGILRKPYKSRLQRKMGRQIFIDEWENCGYVKGNVKYKDYRTNIVNTEQDVADMLKDATKHKEVNTQIIIERKTPLDREHVNKICRNRNLRKRYARVPKWIKEQIRAEYPNFQNTSNREKTREIHNRLTSLTVEYKRRVALTGDKNEFVPKVAANPEYNTKRRVAALRKKYEGLPEQLKTQILLEHPNILEVSDVEDTYSISYRINALVKAYNNILRMAA